MFVGGRETKQLGETRFVRLAGRAITIRLNPFWMLRAQSVVDLLLKLRVRTNLSRRARRRLYFHLRGYRQSSGTGQCASAGFSNTTSEVIWNPPFEIEGEG